MKHFNYQDLLNIKKQNHKKALVYFSISLAIYILLFSGGILLATYENKKIIMVIFSLALSILAVILVGLYVFGVFKNKKDIKVIIGILNSYLFDIEGKIISINPNSITINSRNVIEVTISRDNSTFVAYFDKEFKEFPFTKDMQVQLRTANSFIVYYEVQDEEVSK